MLVGQIGLSQLIYTEMDLYLAQTALFKPEKAHDLMNLPIISLHFPE